MKLNNKPYYNPEAFTSQPFCHQFITIQRPLQAIEVVRYDKFVELLFKQMSPQLMALHSALGVAGEAGELADAIKREYIYGKERDRENIVEELGDLAFYSKSVQLHYGISDQELHQYNADKLSERYKQLTYSDEAAIAREDKQS